MTPTNILNFSTATTGKQTELGLLKAIEEVVKLRLKALTARARLACQNMSEGEAEGLEKQALKYFSDSQKKSTPVINQAISQTLNNIFQNSAVKIAVEISRGSSDAATDLFDETIEEYSNQIFALITPQGTEMAMAA